MVTKSELHFRNFSVKLYDFNIEIVTIPPFSFKVTLSLTPSLFKLWDAGRINDGKEQVNFSFF